MKNPHSSGFIYKELNKLDFHIVDRKVKEIGYTNKQIKVMKKECLRFIALCATKKGPFAPSVILDDYWHNFILDTHLYFKAAKICGRYIHHQPNDGSMTAKAEDKGYFWNGIQAYYDTFGPPNMWVWGLEMRK